MSSSLSLTLLLLQSLLILPSCTFASPLTTSSAISASSSKTETEPGKRGISIPLVHRRREEWIEKRADGEAEGEDGEWVDNQAWYAGMAASMAGKYGGSEGLKKRASSGSVTLTDLNTDGSYSVPLTVGTPSQSFSANFDTGSADFWLLSSSCSLCTGYTLFNPNKTTSFTETTAANTFSISYGSGTAQGYLGTDTVTIGQFTVAKQTMGVITSVTSGLVNSPNSGLLGMGFQGLAISGATPWWQNLATGGGWSSPLFGVQLARYRSVSGANAIESSGGTINLGYTDSSLYSGSISYTAVTTGTSGYWNIPINGVTSQGTTVNVGSSNAAAVDTGTTLIGGPSAAVAAIYAAIPGSVALTGSLAGYYGYPCSASISLVFTFSGISVTVGSQDFNIGTYSSDTTMCTGGVYAVGLASSSPVQWVLGATFMKNVYTVFNYGSGGSASVGFAALPGAASASTAAAATGTTLASMAIASLTSFGAAAPLSSTSGSGSKSGTTTKSTSSVSSGTGVVTIYSTATASPTTTSPSVVAVTLSSTVTLADASGAASASGGSKATTSAARRGVASIAEAGIIAVVSCAVVMMMMI